jgi:hypothetical protein
MVSFVRSMALSPCMFGVVGPECVVAQDADDLTRLLAIFGRRNPEDQRSLNRHQVT